MYTQIFLAFTISVILTLLFKWIIQKSSSSLYTNIRGGTPRAVGIAPFIAMLLLLPSPYIELIAIIGIFAFLDDIIGRKKIKNLSIEFGQLSRGIGMLLVMIVGYYHFGPVSILIGLMIQPLNIADMQPGSACSTVIIMCILVISAIFSIISIIYYLPLVILAACIGYAPFDYKKKIMMGEIGNHSFAIGLGMSYALLGRFLGCSLDINPFLSEFSVTLILFVLTSILIAYIRRKNLMIFIQEKLGIENPYFGDYVMDVMTGGGLGDLIRKILLKNHKIAIKNKFLVYLGFRRLFYNPYVVR